MNYAKEVVELAVFMHDEYEKIAKEEGWKTQESTRVEFKDLPESNKRTMLRIASSVMEWFSE
jgi:hypothetical protein